MTTLLRRAALLLGLPFSVAYAQSVDQLTAHRVQLSAVDYVGKRAVKVTPINDAPNGEAYAILKGADFHNGTIDVDLAGMPGQGAGTAARGFIGIAFRLHGGQFEYIYLRPTNGRADDQVRRNHSTQYSAFPNYDYAALRQRSPERYESYVDLEPGVWTHYRLTIEGTKAALYVNGAAQPCLVVNDLKLGDSTGGVALWVGPETEGYFANLSIKGAP